VVEGYAERMLWRAHATRLWDSTVRDRARELVAGVDCRRPERAPAGAELIGRAAIGAGLVRLDGDEAEQARVIGQLPVTPRTSATSSCCAARRRSKRWLTSGGRKAIASVS
jgi:hypothetical protein